MAELNFDAEMAAVYDDRGPTIFVPGYSVFQQAIALLLETQLHDNATILVMAAGGGAELVSLSTMNKSWQFVGVDPSPAMLGLARHKLTDASNARTKLIQGYVTDAPEGPYDAATSCLVMSMMSDDGPKLDYLKQIRARLRPGAPALIVEMIAPQQPEGWAQFMSLYELNGRANGADEALIERATGVQETLHYCTDERQSELIGQAGFDRIERFFQALFVTGWIARA